MRILIIEDEEHLAAAVARGLEAEGFTVDTALTGTDGLWRAREHPYDVIVLDTSGVYGEWNLNQARMANEILLITTNELPALHSAQKAVAHLERHGIERSRIKLVVNRHNPDLGLDREAIETALSLDVFQLLPSDYETVQKALLEGKAVASSTTLGKSFASMADRLSGRQSATNKRSSLFSGIFSIFDGVLPKG